MGNRVGSSPTSRSEDFCSLGQKSLIFIQGLIAVGIVNLQKDEKFRYNDKVITVDNFSEFQHDFYKGC